MATAFPSMITDWIRRHLMSPFPGLALVAAALFACGAAEPNTVGKTCTSDDSCMTGEVCAPSTRRCVRSCTGNAGCPSSQPTCAPLEGTGPADGGLSLKVCT